MRLFIILSVFIAFTGLILLEIIFPSFLQKYIYPLSMVVTSILLTVVAYLNYTMMQPKIGVKVIVLHKDSDMMKQQFSDRQSETGFFLMIIAENSGRVVVNPMYIHNDKKKNVYLFNSVREKNQKKDPFGYILKEGERYTDVQALNPHYLQVFKKSSALYVEDIRKRKYSISKKDLKIGQKYIKKMESESSTIKAG